MSRTISKTVSNNIGMRLLSRWLLYGEWRAHPLRAVVAIAAIALGVALGFAIDLINGAAFNEFSAAVKSLSGQSDLQVRGVQSNFDENLYVRLRSTPGVALASPVVEIDAVVPGEKNALKVLGIDVFQAAQIAPDLIGVATDDRRFDTLADDAIFLSPAAMSWLKVKTGDSLTLRAGTAAVRLRVAGGLVRSRPGQRLGVMDIGALQWRFERLGKLSWVDLKLLRGVDRARFRKDLPALLGAPVVVTELADQEARTDNMSRAYRVNLNVLALVALFTGAFLVFSTQALSVIRRRPQLALLRVVGVTRRHLLAQILLEGGLLGVAGALLGLAGGYAMAAAALHFFGGDLGGGYFPGVQPSVQFDPVSALIFFLLGSGIAVLGSLAPAWEAANAPLAPALKAGSEDTALSKLGRPWPGLACLGIGALLTQAPPVLDLPLFGYFAVALILVGGIALMPRLAALTFSVLARHWPTRLGGALPTLALGRLANAPNQASIALGGVLSSFSLMVAMAIMVASFRVSVDDWLEHILSADLYVRSAMSGDTGALKPAEQRAIAAVPGVAQADFLRVSQLVLDVSRPAVALIAREIDIADPARALPMTEAVLPTAALDVALKANRALPAWASEAMVDLYGHAPGKVVTLAIGTTTQQFVIAGIWRDYARQSGSLQMRLADYQALTGDRDINDAALRLRPGATSTQVTAALRALPFGALLSFAEPGEIRAISLKIFDRSFAVTYLLEAVAIIIGLFGVAATFSAQTLARAREFGMLRHIGVTRRQILILLAAEGGMLAAIGIAAGFAIGFCISLILVFIVNPQSFHWTMRLHVPWMGLAIVAVVLLVSAALTALVSGRVAVSGSALRAVREDW
ncbi:MAG: ABC transporter permease [Herminiimonas sp.]|nr:ABC transporter permease [Herminiimonas sp.]